MMTQVSRPFQIALLATVAFLGIWVVALKPSSSSSSAAQPSKTNFASGVLSAPAKARAAVAAANAASAAHGATVVAPPTPPSTTGSPTGPHATAPSAKGSSAAGAAVASSIASKPNPAAPLAKRLDVVSRALRADKVIALLFYNPAAADDQAVKNELAAIPRDSGKVVELAVPISELARYPVVTTQVPVNTSPTLVVIGRNRRATTITGFADSFEIAQRIADALRAV